MDVIQILDVDDLYRRVLPFHIRVDGAVSSSAFKDRRGKPETHISVDVARMTTIDACIGRAPGTGAGVAAISAGSARELGFDVRHDPMPDNPAHALIEGANDKALCRELAERCVLIRVPSRRETA